MKERIGLIVREEHQAKEGLENLLFMVRVGSASGKKKGDLFYLSQYVEGAVRGGKVREGELGHAALLLNRKTKKIVWTDFQPLGYFHIPLLWEGRGLGSIVSASIASRLKKGFPGYTVEHWWRDADDPSPARVKQLERWGIEVGKPYTVEEYHMRIQSYLREMFKRFPPSGKRLSALRGRQRLSALKNPRRRR